MRFVVKSVPVLKKGTKIFSGHEIDISSLQFELDCLTKENPISIEIQPIMRGGHEYGSYTHSFLIIAKFN